MREGGDNGLTLSPRGERGFGVNAGPYEMKGGEGKEKDQQRRGGMIFDE